MFGINNTLNDAKQLLINHLKNSFILNDLLKYQILRKNPFNELAYLISRQNIWRYGLQFTIFSQWKKLHKQCQPLKQSLHFLPAYVFQFPVLDVGIVRQ